MPPIEAIFCSDYQFQFAVTIRKKVACCILITFGSPQLCKYLSFVAPILECSRSIVFAYFISLLYVGKIIFLKLEFAFTILVCS